MNTFLSFVENAISKDCSRKALKSAGASFASFLKKSPDNEISKKTVDNWIASMCLDGLKSSTRRKYTRELSLLYANWNGNKNEQSPFDSAKFTETETDETATKRMLSNLQYVSRLLKISPKNQDYETVSIFLYLLFNVGMRLQDIINLKFGDDTIQLSQTDDIVETMHRSGRKKYVFGLEQGKKREGQIIRELTTKIHKDITVYGLDFGNTFSRDSITSLWIAAAAKAGIPVTDIRSVITSVPAEYPSLSLVSPTPLTDERRFKILQKVADNINDGSSKWFVMKMRQGINPENIREAIKQHFGNHYDNMLFFYPSHTVVSRDKTGRKIKNEQPYLPSILFFKLRKDKVAELFSKIGDIAWCYKWTNSPDSPYSTISQQEMKAFQRHIGSFSPDIRMELVPRTTALTVDQTVRINGGMMENHIGVIRSVKNSNGTRTYTLDISEKISATWTVEDIDEIYIEPVATNQP